MARRDIRLGDRLVGDANPVYLVAEIGINHNGDMQIAKKLIDAAHACAWDCVKFQKRTPDLCVPEHQKPVLRDTPWGKIPYIDYRYKVEFERPQYDYIDGYCREKPLAWSASAWDTPSLEFLLRYDVPFIKVPSAKLSEHEFLAQVATSGKPVILSTGMSTMEEIDAAVEVLEKRSKGNYLLMHTNSAYPAPAADLNLRVMETLRQRYDCIVGYSGHEYDLEPTVIAVALGARVIERHVTLSHTLWGSDQFASLEVHAMDLLAKRIRDVDAILGDGVRRVTEKEQEARKKLRGS